MSNLCMSSVDATTISFACERIWNSEEYLFWFKLTWTLPPYLQHDDIISGFTVNSQIMDRGGRRLFNSAPAVLVTIPYPQV